MSKKKRQFFTIIILIVVLAVSGVAYMILSKHQTKQEKQDAEKEKQETEQITLYSMKADEITQIHFINSSQDMTLVKTGDQWKDSADSNFPVNQEYAQDMAEEAGEMKASQLVVKDPEDLSQYQLDKPSYSIELTNQSGETRKLVVGEESAAAGGCYAYVDQADKVYVIASNLTDYFGYTRGEMMAVPEAPDITAEYVTGYKMQPAKGKAFVAKYDETKAEFADVDGWDLSGAYQATVPGSQDALQSFFAGLTSLEVTEGVEYHATSKLLKQYGLAEPAYVLDIDYDTVEEDTEEDTDDNQEEKEDSQTRTPHHYRISVGSHNDQEDQYYVSIDGSDGIYLMSAESIDALVDINAFDYIYKPVHKAVMENLQDIRFTYQGQEHEIKVSKKEVENGISEDGSTVYDYTILLDEKTELDEYAFQDVYSSVFSNLVYSGERDNTIKGKGEEVQASMTIVTDKRKIDLHFLPYDGNNFYRVEQNGSCNFLVDINVVENAMKQLLSVDTVEEAKAKETQEPSGE